MRAVATEFSVLFPSPIRPDTLAGYVEYASFLPLSILFAVWAMIAATGAVRGDEERGVVEATLASGLSRWRAVSARTLAFAIAITIASLAAAAGFAIGASAGGDPFDARALIEEAVLIIALGLSCYALSMLASQLAAARLATATAGILLLALFLLNSLSRTFSSLSLVRWLSPFRYVDLTRPLPPGGTFEIKSVIVLIGISVAATVLAALAFAVRDLGSPLIRPPVREHATSYDATRAPWWSIPVIRGLYDHRIGLVAWSIGLAGLAVIFVSLTKTIVQPLLSIPAFAPYFQAFVQGDVYPSFLGYIWLNVAQLLFAAYAITQVARWSAEDGDGRLELILSQPMSRVGVVLERMTVLALGALLIAAISGEAVFYASRSNGIVLNGSRLAAASLMLIPFTLVFASAGALLAAWNPRAAVGLLGAVAFASYMDVEVGALLKLPLWVQDLSAFKLFGRPLLTGVDSRNLAIMLLVALAGLGSSILVMQRRDVGS
jgi:ABC-2 type transport system permease protein